MNPKIVGALSLPLALSSLALSQNVIRQHTTLEQYELVHMFVYYSTCPITPIFEFVLKLFDVQSDQGLRYVPLLFSFVLAYWASIGYLFGWGITAIKNQKEMPNKAL